jgi:hypothetical protein
VRPPGLPPQSGPLGAIVRGSQPLRCEVTLVSLARSREAGGERRGSGPRRIAHGGRGGCRIRHVTPGIGVPLNSGPVALSLESSGP